MNTNAAWLAAVGCGVALQLSVSPQMAEAQDAPRFGVVLETAAVWSRRNDVRIPPDTATEFSIVDLIGSGPTGAVRVEATAEFNQRHGLRFAYAPIRVAGSGVPESPIDFAGGQFAAFPTRAEYQFDSFRVTYRYRVYNGDTWRWKVGFTGFVRDARIALAQTGATAENTDVGFVPLGHLSGEARLSERWGLRLEVDGSAAPQGRAFDVLAVVEYRPSARWTIAGGYRTIEGGADVDTVYTFAWLNAAVARLTVGF
jgi:hypothetical protein